MLEIAYLLTFFISCAYALLTYFCSFFMDQTISPLPYGILLVCVLLFYFLGKTGGYRTTTTSFKSTFFKTLFLIFIPGILLSTLYQGEKALPALSTATPYLIVFLTSGIFLLQLLRHTSGTADQKKFERFQKIQAFSFFLAAFVGTVFHVFEWIMYALNLIIIRPIGYIFAGLFSSISQSVAGTESQSIFFGEDGYINFMKDVHKETGQLSVEDAMNGFRDFISNEAAQKEPQPVSQTLSIIVTVVIAVVLVFVLILILTGVKKEKRKTLIIDEKREESIEDYAIPERLKKHFAPPDIQIRFYYKKFMKKANSENARLTIADTTRDISDKYLKSQQLKHNSSEKTLEQTHAASELTNLYRKTRYSHQPVNKEDVATMKKLLKSC